MIEYRDNKGPRIIFQLQGSVYKKALKYSIPAALLAVGFGLWREFDDTNQKVFDTIQNSYAYSVFTFSLGFVLVFRCQLAYARFWEGRSALEQMTNQWTDAVIKCVTFDKVTKDLPAENLRLWRMKIISMFSVMHGVGLSSLQGHENPIQVLQGLDPSIEAQLNSANIRSDIYLCYAWVQDELVRRLKEGGLAMPPPIATRIWQDLTAGMQGFNNAAMVADTPFPFPYAQIISLMLMVLTCTCGYVFAAFVDDVIALTIVTFFAVSSFWALNYIAQELEDPFGEDDNDLPLAWYQTHHNNVLQQLLFIGEGDFEACTTSFEAEQAAEAYRDPSSRPAEKKPTVMTARRVWNGPKRAGKLLRFDWIQPSLQRDKVTSRAEERTLSFEQQ